MAVKQPAPKVQSIQSEAQPPMTSAGSNLAATEPEAVGNVILETDIDPNAIMPSDDEIEEQAAEIALAITSARAAINGESVGPVVAQAVAFLPTDREAALRYCKTLLRMQQMAESVVREIQVAFWQKFGT